MLVITRRAGQAIKIGDDITVTVTRIKGGGAMIGIDAPSDVLILRTELDYMEESRRQGRPTRSDVGSVAAVDQRIDGE